MSIQIYFGPYEAHGVIRHKPQRLHGVLRRLTELQYEIELIATNFLNVVTVQMRGKEIFRCDIRNLQFNIDADDDAVAQNFIKAVEEANSRLNSDENIPLLPAKETSSKHYHNTEDYFSEDVELLFEIAR